LKSTAKVEAGYYGITVKHFFRALLVLTLASTFSVCPDAQTGGSGRSVGPIMARVTVDIYSDFQCPSCKMLAEQTLNRVMEEYASKGRIRLVHHDFPLPMHKYAKQAALLATAADRIGKFAQVSEALFKQQSTWEANGQVEAAVDSVLTPAEAKQVHELAKDPAVAAIVQRDIDLGMRLNVTATPTIILTKDLKSNRVTGAVSYAVLKRYLDQLLAP
jgi:protein-disulfide isomerase